MAHRAPRLAPLTTVAALAVVPPGCQGVDVAFVEAEDTRMDPVRQYQQRAAHDAGTYGDVYVLSLQGANEVNGWVGGSLETLGSAFELLGEYSVLASEDEGWLGYGPYEDWQGRDLSWLFRLRGDESVGEFEAYVGRRGAGERSDMERVLAGYVENGAQVRFGGFELDFDVVERHDEMLFAHDRDKVHAGTLEVAFERDTDTPRKRVDIDYHDFSVTMDYPVPEYFAAHEYEFQRTVDGSGFFHVDFETTFQTQLWSGPDVEQMVLDVQWNGDGAGQAHGQVLESSDQGDLVYGDLTIDECFGADGYLTWRQISEGYARAFPAYGFGDATSCGDHRRPARQ